MRAIVFHKNVLTDWSDNLPMVSRIMNASVHSAIGTTPASIVFGNAIDLDRGIFLPYAPSTHGKDIRLTEWTQKMLLNQSLIFDAARQYQERLLK